MSSYFFTLKLRIIFLRFESYQTKLNTFDGPKLNCIPKLNGALKFFSKAKLNCRPKFDCRLEINRRSKYDHVPKLNYRDEN